MNLNLSHIYEKNILNLYYKFFVFLEDDSFLLILLLSVMIDIQIFFYQNLDSSAPSNYLTEWSI